MTRFSVGLVVAMLAVGCKEAPADQKEGPGGTWAGPRTAIARPPAGPPALGDVVLWEGARDAESSIGGLAERPGREPIGMDVDGDGVEEAIGFLGSPGEPHLFPAVIDAKTVEPRWVGPPPTLAKGVADERGVFIQAIRGRILVTTADGRVIVYDAKTGAQRTELALNARVENTCVVEGGLIRIDQKNDVHFDFDPETDSFREMIVKCPRSPWGNEGKDEWRYGGHEEIEFHMRLADGHVWKGVDKRTRTVFVARAPMRGMTPVWTTTLGDDQPVALPAGSDFYGVDGNDIFVEYQRGEVVDRLEWPKGTGEYVVMKLDAATGAIAWTATPPKKSGGASGSLVTKTHLWIARHTQLEVYDRATGKQAGYIGWR